MINEFKDIIGIKSKEKLGLENLTLDYQNSFFKNSLLPIIFMLNTIFMHKKELFERIDLNNLIPKFLLDFFISLLKNIFLFGEYFYSNYYIIFCTFLILIIVIFIFGYLGIFCKFEFHINKKTLSNGKIKYNNFIRAYNRLAYILFLSMSDFWIIFIFSKNVLNRDFRLDNEFLSYTFCIVSFVRIFIIIFNKLFSIESRENYSDIDVKYILELENNKYSYRYLLIDKKLDLKIKSNGMNDNRYSYNFYLLKDIAFTSPNYIFLRIKGVPKKQETNLTKYEYYMDDIYYSDNFDDVKYVFERNIRDIME